MGCGDIESIFDKFEGTLVDSVIFSMEIDNGTMDCDDLPFTYIDDDYYYPFTTLDTGNKTKDYFWCEETHCGAKILKGEGTIMYMSNIVWERGVAHLMIKYSRSQMEVTKTQNMPLIISYVISGY